MENTDAFYAVLFCKSVAWLIVYASVMFLLFTGEPDIWDHIRDWVGTWKS